MNGDARTLLAAPAYLDAEARRAEAALEATLGRPWELWRRRAQAR